MKPSAQQLPAEAAALVPRQPRIPLSLTTSMRAGGASPRPVHLRNISSMGFMAETREDLRAGTIVAVKIPGIGLRRAIVRWSIGTRIGARFAARIDLKVVRTAAPGAFAP
jgi:hypothetical protein